MKLIASKPLFLFVAIFSAVSSLQLRAHETLLEIILKNNRAVKIVKLDAGDKEMFGRGKEVFIKAFTTAYKEYTPEQLYLENKPDYLKRLLENALEDEENEFNTQKEGVLFVVAQDAATNEIIGFVGYDVHRGEEKNTVYIKQLAVEPTCKNQGLGKVLVIDTINNIMRNKPVLVTVCTRKINQPAVGFYYKLGFEDAPMAEVHPQLPEYKYCGFKLNLSGK